MHELFISYRRIESQTETELLYQQIRQYYCANAIYYDHVSMHGGAPFPQDIADAIKRCHVMIVVIGPQWDAILRVHQTNPEDWVRIEIEQAIALGKPIIPVLINGRPIPQAAQLPPSIRSLVYREVPGCHRYFALWQPGSPKQGVSHLVGHGVRRTRQANKTSA